MNNNGPAYTTESRQMTINPIPEDEIQEIEDERIAKLEEAGIDESAVISEMHRFMGGWQAINTDNDNHGRDDLNFLYVDQWSAQERSEFLRLQKPALQVNKMYDPYRKIMGEQRANTPQIKVKSLTGKATDESVLLHSDMLKRIAYSSNSKKVYQNCFQSALSYSYGAFLVDFDYESSDSFHKEIIYRWKMQPEKCFWDARAIEVHKGDGNFCGCYLSLSHEEYDARYPNAPHPTSFSDPQLLTQFQWYSRNSIVVCDYWVKEYYTKVVYELGNEEVVTKEEYQELKSLHEKTTKHIERSIPEGFPDDDDSIQFITGMVPAMLEIVQERVTDDYKIMHYRCTADKILEFSEWPSTFLPLVFVPGEIFYKEGMIHTRTFINQGKDAQRTINYLACEIAGQLKNSSRSQWLATPANIVGPDMEFQWRNPEAQMGALIAIPDPTTKLMPQKQTPSEIPQSLFIHYERSTRDLKEVLGVHDTQLDNGVEDSGRAIFNRQIQAVGSSAIFFDNLNAAIEYGARAALDMLPKVYDTKRTLTLTRANGQQYTVTINQKMPDGSIKNEVSKSDLDLELEAGPSYAIQKQQAVEILVKLISASPEVFPIVADLLAKNLDLEFSQQLVERLKTLVPAHILAKEEGREPPPPPPNPQEEMMKKQMMLADAKLEEQNHEIKVREQRLVIDQERAQLEKAQILLDLQELQHKMRESEARDATENNKAQLNYSAKIAQIIANIDKGKHDNSLRG